MDSMPRLTSFLFFFIILWLHFLCVANAAYAERRTSEVSSTPVGEQECQASIPNSLKLRVPKKKGFNEFVSVCKEYNTSAPIIEKKDSTSAINPCVTGFSIDVFRAALELSTSKVNELQFSPFDTEDYDEILEDVPDNPAQHDAVVGDVTIKGYRASWVDFTMSYLDSTIYILVPTKHGTRKNMWLFLKPLSPNLWLVIIMAFIFVGVLIGTLEMRSNVTNTDFSGSLLQQLGMMIWYPVSMLVLPERRMVVSMWSKLVLVVWLYTAFVIMQSYTANFTTMLTIDQLRPFFNQKGNYSVGYQEGSFVRNYLITKFGESRIKNYSTMEDYHEALCKGSDNGGVAAVYDELPYIKLFLQKYGSQFSVSGPISRTNGLGFAFPLKSCLAPLISKAIMNLTDEGKITELEHKYFGEEETSEVEISRLPEETPSLDAYNFIGIFIVAGSISIACLFCSEIWRARQFVKRVSSTRIVNVIGDSPDHQYQLPSTTTSTSIIQIVSMEEKRKQENGELFLA